MHHRLLLVVSIHFMDGKTHSKQFLNNFFGSNCRLRADPMQKFADIILKQKYES